MSLLAGLVIFGGAPALGLILGALAYRQGARRFLNGRWS